MNHFKCLLLFLVCCMLHLDASTFLRDRLETGKAGDYIVTAIDKTYTVLLIREKQNSQISLEEITIPAQRLQTHQGSWSGWRSWVENGAPGHTSWLMYSIPTDTGMMHAYFSYTKGQWCPIADSYNFLSTLLNLNFSKLPRNEMKRVGVVPPSERNGQETRAVWSPKMVYEGQVVKGVPFGAWRARWPKDQGELSDKTITVYLPEEDNKFPSYFPYWLEIQGGLGKAKIRIIDSGRDIQSPRSLPQRQMN
jgi:hypothetical protein